MKEDFRNTACPSSNDVDKRQFKAYTSVFFFLYYTTDTKKSQVQTVEKKVVLKNMFIIEKNW